MKRHITTLCVGGVLAFALFGVAMAGPLEDGQAAYQRGDYAEAMRLLRPLAERADARAQTDLGLMYDNGRGVPKDYGQAVAWYHKAKEQGCAAGLRAGIHVVQLGWLARIRRRNSWQGYQKLR